MNKLIMLIGSVLCAGAPALGATGLGIAPWSADPTPTTEVRIEEDEPGWDCRTMGNLICGPKGNLICGPKGNQ